MCFFRFSEPDAVRQDENVTGQTVRTVTGHPGVRASEERIRKTGILRRHYYAQGRRVSCPGLRIV